MSNRKMERSYNVKEGRARERVLRSSIATSYNNYSLNQSYKIVNPRNSTIQPVSHEKLAKERGVYNSSAPIDQDKEKKVHNWNPVLFSNEC